MSSDRSNKEVTNPSDIEWTPENEIKLFYALRGHKPVGVSKNFHMIAILDEFSRLTEKDISSKIIWDRLEKLYDMDILHDNENLPFPSNTVPFTIEGIKEFDELIVKSKTGTDSNKSEKLSEPMDEIEVIATPTKTGSKTKTQDSTKSNSKVKPENEKNSKSERKEDNTKTSDKSDDTEEKGNRSKKQTPKAGTELRSSSTTSAKKRK